MVTLLISKPISSNKLLLSYKVIANQNNQSNLEFFTYYQDNSNGAGYSLDLISSQSSLTINPPSPYFIVLNKSRADNKFFVSQKGNLKTFEILYNPVSQKSVFKMSYINRLSPNKMQTAKVTANGVWNTILT
jgi:hypothetical protein